MIFSRKKLVCQLDLQIDNQSSKETPTTKFLGVYIDNKLYWKTHIYIYIYIYYVRGKLQGELEF